MPDFPQLPTDNLYKFLALAGVTLIVLAVWLMASRAGRLWRMLFALKRKVAREQARGDAIDRDAKMVYKVPDPHDAVALAEKLDVDTRMHTSALRAKLLGIDNEELLHAGRQVSILLNCCAALTVAGVALSALGFSLWYTRVQKPQDALLAAQLDSITARAHTGLAADGSRPGSTVLKGGAE